jgi:aldehyde dehydrogenase (NAD+)
VLVIGPGNYPLFLPGVQTVQALVAGNAVLLKPGSGGAAAAAGLVDCLREAGVPEDLVHLLGESREEAQEALAAGVDKVILTGSSETGKLVLTALAPRIVPAVVELSGWDPVVLLDDADPTRASAAVRFGVRLNSGNTCIRPRRVLGSTEMLSRFQRELGSLGEALEFVACDSEEEAVRRAGESEYALGATVFGSLHRATELAKRLRAGVVVINDMIVPTAHPALPFGGRGRSGFGVTRGAEGLLEMTTIKAIATQSGKWLPHLMPPKTNDSALFAGFIRALHGPSLAGRLRAGTELLGALLRRRKES